MPTGGQVMDSETDEMPDVSGTDLTAVPGDFIADRTAQRGSIIR